MLQQIIDRRLVGQEQVDRQPRALPAPLPASRSARRCARRSATAASATSRRARTSRCPSATSSEPAFGHGPGGAREMRAPRQPGIRARRPHRAAAGRRRRRRRQRRRRSDGRGRGRLRLPPHREEFMQIFFDDLALPRLIAHAAAGRRAGMEEPAAPATLPKARRPTCTWCARCAARSAGASRWAATRARELQRARGSSSTNCAAAPDDADAPSSKLLRKRDRANCARGSSAFPSSTRSTCAIATASRADADQPRR